ncbi:MAG: histidinol phosphate phosphatase domain-containing protein [Candidatus Omnitrophica bacterium]|nr:histidinol phosphate phosphatase domain-containing protein [Candidatus Omnitrophota bacterium]
MYDLHTHSLLSDGVLLPSEMAVRYAALGFKAIAITDHVDYSNIEQVIHCILAFCKHWSAKARIKVLPGVELTHLPLKQFGPLAKYARRRGIKIIVAHGQTVAEPVIKDTNRAALEADIDILAHPGFINEEEIRLAKRKGIFLEISCRRGHRDTNDYVVRHALKLGARLILNTDSHMPEDIIAPAKIIKLARNSGLSLSQIRKIYQEVARVFKI